MGVEKSTESGRQSTAAGGGMQGNRCGGAGTGSPAGAFC